MTIQNGLDISAPVHDKYDSRVNLYLEKQQDSITRGHSLKLANDRYHYDLRTFYFAPRIVNVWKQAQQLARNSNISRYNRHFQKTTR